MKRLLLANTAGEAEDSSSLKPQSHNALRPALRPKKKKISADSHRSLPVTNFFKQNIREKMRAIRIYTTRCGYLRPLVDNLTS